MKFNIGDIVKYPKDGPKYLIVDITEHDQYVMKCPHRNIYNKAHKFEESDFELVQKGLDSN